MASRSGARYLPIGNRHVVVFQTQTSGVAELARRCLTHQDHGSFMSRKKSDVSRDELASFPSDAIYDADWLRQVVAISAGGST